jgi:antitoxin VapB
MVPGFIMALNIKNPEADRLAHELAQVTGESLTETVIRALRERLSRVVGRRSRRGLRDDIARIQARVATLPRLDPRSDEELLGYDASGLPQ